MPKKSSARTRANTTKPREVSAYAHAQFRTVLPKIGGDYTTMVGHLVARMAQQYRCSESEVLSLIKSMEMGEMLVRLTDRSLDQLGGMAFEPTPLPPGEMPEETQDALCLELGRELHGIYASLKLNYGVGEQVLKDAILFEMMDCHLFMAMRRHYVKGQRA